MEGGPTCVIVLGMAGSGKTTLVRKLYERCISGGRKPFAVNLDPACSEVAYPASVDIRDTVSYKEVMRRYRLGPNGAIVTSLNLFATKFHQMVSHIKENSAKFDTFIFDTPGQIEVFTWSASGSIITEALASSFPTVIVYVLDTVRSENPVTFMSNMLYACSIMYKTKLPFLIAMNKIDVVAHEYALDWMRDFESLELALENERSYVSNLTRSMCLALDDFYNSITAIGVSSVNGSGFDSLVGALSEARHEYERDYKSEWEKVREAEGSRTNSKTSSGVGESVDLVHAVSSGVEISDIYLRHPGDPEESSDSEGEITVAGIKEEEELEEEKEKESFNKFLERHAQAQKKKRVAFAEPTTSSKQ